MAGHSDATEEVYCCIADMASCRQTCLPSSFCEVPNKLDPAVVVTVEHWEDGRISARTPVSATDDHSQFANVAAGRGLCNIGVQKVCALTSLFLMFSVSQVMVSRARFFTSLL
jgi:hypothetical protein